MKRTIQTNISEEDVPINIVTEEEMIRSGLEKGHLQEQARRRAIEMPVTRLVW